MKISYGYFVNFWTYCISYLRIILEYELYYNELFHQVKMSYNRFIIISRCWHIKDSIIRENTDRLCKIQILMNIILQKTYISRSILVIKESMIAAFKGRLLFLQYNPSKLINM